MYLKEIKISGFKSFADKININLSDDITCIVGPNGSGKSNIVDAIKWVLGEQSVKTLRGSNNMTDVIFSGSSSRNPLNIASVSIVFDNSDSYIKVPFTEISVTRKVYRNGENEYYLNNEKCRLKDISDLFLDTGMGKYAMNIISQGEISKVISDSPLERRVIFEEAAGVLKYKKRKNECLSRLEKTNENLTRVEDIIKELSTQVEPLKEQSTKAKLYLETKDKLKNLEVSLIANDLETLDNDYKETTNKKELLENEIIKMSNDTTKSDITLEEEKQNLTKINEKIVDLNNQYLNLTKEEERLNGEKNIIKERSKYDAKDIKVHTTITNLKEQTLMLSNDLESNKKDIEILKNKIDDLTTILNKEKINLNEHQQNRNKVELEIDEKTKNLTDITYKIKTLENYIEQGASIPSSVKKVLSNPKLKGIHKTISNAITIDDTYNIALEVALGSSANYVIVDTPDIAKTCINYLKENNLGRVTFFPLDVIKPRYIDEETMTILKNTNGFIDTLANLTHYDNIYKNIIYNQLGNVLLVDTLSSANYISKLIHNRYKIVTIEGEIINVGGSITGGSLKTKSIISEKYELKSLKNKEEELKINIQNLKDATIKQITYEKQQQIEIINKEKEKLLLNEQLQTKEKTFNTINQEYQQAKLELSNLESLNNNTIDEEEQKIIEKYYKVVHDKENVYKEIEIQTRKKEEKTTNIEKLESLFRLNNSNLRQKEQILKELEIKNTKISTKMDNLLNILSENYNMTYEKAKANYILEQDEEIARTTVNELKNELKKIGVVNIGAIEEYERVSKRYEFLTKQSNDLQNAISTLMQIIDELDVVMKEEFNTTFNKIEEEFNKVFKELFGGGEAKLKLTDKENILETGVDIIVTPPGKKLSSISLLSGGEKTLTAISLLFAILNIKQIPFCIFDEVEAALDEANVDKIGAYFKKYIGKTQLIIITHKKKTMEYANALYGITMQESGVSKLVSVKLID